MTLTNEDKALAYSQLRAEKRVNGLLFGGLAGLCFSLAIWGMDAVLLFQASSDWPWMKFVIGMPLCILFGALAGWVTARFDNGFLGFIFWLMAGLGFVWVASHVPFEGSSTLIGWLEPDVRGLDIYPFVPIAKARMGLLDLVVGGLTALVGAVSLFAIEAATRASTTVRRWFILFFSCVLMFGPIGLLADGRINEPLRTPVLAISRLIQNGRQAEVTPFSPAEVRQMGLRALKPFGDLIDRPYRLVLGYYDPESMTEMSVYVNFDGVWGNCFITNDTPLYCQLSTDRYLKRLNCLLEGGTDESCWIKTTPDALAQTQAMRKQIGEKPAAGIYLQRGEVILVDFSGQGQDFYRCRLREMSSVFLEACEPSQTGQAVQMAPIDVSSTPSVSASAGSETETMSAVLLPTVQGELPVFLTSAPRYTIELTIDYSKLTFQGRARLDYTNTENISMQQIYFRLLPNGQSVFGNGSLTVTQALVDGQSADTELSVSDSVLAVTLPEPLKTGRRMQFEFVFNGVVPVDFGGDVTPEGYGIYNFTQDVLALSAWYPMLAVYDDQGWNLDPVSGLGDSGYSDIAFYSVDITVPENLMVAATGVQTDRQVTGDQARLHFESGPARDFFVIASPNFQVTSQTVNGTNVNSYYLPTHQGAGAEALRVATGSLRVFNEQFGVYPYTELDVVDAPMRNALGVEFPSIVLIGDSLYDAPENPDFSVAIAHEVAHQWWYNIVGNNVFDEPWLDEALTTYSSSLYYEFGLGEAYRQGLLDYWQGRYDTLVQDGNDEGIAHDLTYFENLDNPRVYSGVVYTKGALFFEALRDKIGDKAFFAALRNYYKNYAFQIATGKDLLAAFEAAYGKPLDAFYQVWLYSKR
jgi:hypothetical protein